MNGKQVSFPTADLFFLFQYSSMIIVQLATFLTKISLGLSNIVLNFSFPVKEHVNY